MVYSSKLMKVPLLSHLNENVSGSNKMQHNIIVGLAVLGTMVLLAAIILIPAILD